MPYGRYSLLEGLNQWTPSNYSQDVEQDPEYLQRMQEMQNRVMQTGQESTLLQAEPGGTDMASGQPSTFEATNRGIPDDQGSVMDAVGTIVGAPLGLLRKGIVEPVQDFLGAPQAMQRQRFDAYADIMDKNNYLQLGLTPYQHELIQPGSVDRSGLTALQTGGGTMASGQSREQVAPAKSRMPGVIEWIKNLTRDDRARRAAGLMAAKTMLQQNAMGAQSIERMTASQLNEAQTAEVAPNAASVRSMNAAHSNQYNSSAWASKQHGLLFGAQTGGEYEKRNRDEEAFAREDVQDRALHEAEMLKRKREGEAYVESQGADMSLKAQKYQQGEQLFGDVTLPSGRLALQQQREGKTPGKNGTDPLKLEETIRKNLVDQLMKARKDGNVSDEELYSVYQVPKRKVPGTFWGESEEPDWESWRPSLQFAPPSKSSSATDGTPPPGKQATPGQNAAVTLTPDKQELLRQYPTPNAVGAAVDSHKISEADGDWLMQYFGKARKR